MILEEDVHLFFSFSMRCAYMLFEDSPFKKGTATVRQENTATSGELSCYQRKSVMENPDPMNFGRVLGKVFPLQSSYAKI